MLDVKRTATPPGSKRPAVPKPARHTPIVEALPEPLCRRSARLACSATTRSGPSGKRPTRRGLPRGARRLALAVLLRCGHRPGVAASAHAVGRKWLRRFRLASTGCAAGLIDRSADFLIHVGDRVGQEIANATEQAIQPRACGATCAPGEEELMAGSFRVGPGPKCRARGLRR